MQRANRRSLQFGALQAEIDWRSTRATAAVAARAGFSWQGFDEDSEVCGRDHAQTVDGQLQGHLFTHQGGDPAFRAVREPAAASVRKPVRKKKSV